MREDIPSVTVTLSGKQVTFDLDDKKLPDAISNNTFESCSYPYPKRMKRKEYEEALLKLQLELVKVQAWQQETGARIMMLFEGRDAAGKGGTINVFRANLNARNAKVVALCKPSDTEMGQWYYQRYISHFPTARELVMFDRSWYNRAGVEPVMGFCSQEQHEHFLEETPDFEKMIVNENIHFFKFWLNVGQEMQIQRFHDRRQNPLKRWKLSPIDIKALTKWEDYTKARDIMFEKTHTEFAPWTIVRSNDKRRARINAIRHFLLSLDYTGKDEVVIGEVDKNILGQGPEFLNTHGA